MNWCDLWLFANLQVTRVEPPEHFLRYFGRECGMAPRSLFAGASHEDEEDEFRDFVKKRVAPVAHELDWNDVMLPLQRQRLMDATEDYGLGEVDETGKARHALIDLNQNPRERKTIVLHPELVGQTMFPFTHHGFVWDTELEKPLLTLQWALGHGMISMPELFPYEVPPVNIRQVLRNQSVTYTKMRELIGLGWHEISMGSWLMYNLSSIELRSMFQPLRTIQPRRIDHPDELRA